MTKPIIEFSYRTLDEGRNHVIRKMMVSLDDIEGIDQSYLYIKDSYESYELAGGEYDRLRKALLEEWK